MSRRNILIKKQKEEIRDERKYGNGYTRGEDVIVWLFNIIWITNKTPQNSACSKFLRDLSFCRSFLLTPIKVHADFPCN